MSNEGFNPGLGKRIFGIIACTLAGTLGGILGSLAALLMGSALHAGLLGQEEPSFIGTTLSGEWVFGLCGIFPGTLIGFAYGVTNNNKIWLTIGSLALLSSCATEIAYGYPTNVRTILYYIVSPILIIMGSAYFASRLKIHLKLMPPELAEGFKKADEE